MPTTGQVRIFISFTKIILYKNFFYKKTDTCPFINTDLPFNIKINTIIKKIYVSIS
jgi:hypothetical protein